MSRAKLARDLRAHLDWQLLCGADGLPAGRVDAPEGSDAESVAASAGIEGDPGMTKASSGGRGAGGRPAATPRPRVAAVRAQSPDLASGPAPAPAGVASAGTLADLRDAIGDCRRCKLCEARTQVVFGVGNPAARLLFVGEGPGREEDRQGEPFVGRAGQLLTDIIEKGMKLTRQDVYICNVVKCRPPENRNPEPDEIAACRPFLERQIDLVGPEVIVGLGKFAAQTLLGSTTPISRLRGAWAEYRGIPFMPTLHPAYLLRNPADKRLVWQDIQMVMARLGLAR